MIGLDGVVRSEQAIVGTLLAGNRRLDEVSSLRPEDFGQPAFQAVFAAIVAVRAENPGAYGGLLFALVTEQAKLPSIDSTYLHGLAVSRPAAADFAEHVHTVQEAGLRRSLASHADRIAGLVGDVRGTDAELDHLDRLSQVLDRRALRFDSPSRIEDVPAGLGSPLSTGSSQESVQVDREDLILADLLQNPDMLAEVQGWLSPEFFVSGQHREVYEAIITIARNGEPINERTLVDKLEPEPVQVDAGAVASETDAAALRKTAESVPDFLARLMTRNVFEGMALAAGRDLLDDNIRMEFAAMRTRMDVAAPGADATPRRNASRASEATPRTQVRGPELLQPPPAPGLGPDGPQMRM